MMLILSTWIPSGHHGQGPLTVPTTRLACLPVKHATVSILHFPWGKVWGHWVLKFTWGHPLLLCQPEMSPLHSRAPGGEVPEGAGTQGLPLLLLWAQTSQIGHLVSSHLPRLARAASGPCLSWCPSQGYFWMTRGPTPWQRSPATLVGEGWVTGLTF